MFMIAIVCLRNSFNFLVETMAFSWEKHALLMTMHYAILCYGFGFSWQQIIALEILYAMTFMMMVANM